MIQAIQNEPSSCATLIIVCFVPTGVSYHVQHLVRAMLMDGLHLGRVLTPV